MYKCINMYINVYNIYIYICIYLALQPQNFDIGMLQCVAVSMLQCVAVCVAVRWVGVAYTSRSSHGISISVRGSALQCVAVSMLQCVTVRVAVCWVGVAYTSRSSHGISISVRGSVLQCVAVRCSVCCSVLDGCGTYLALQPRDFDIGSWNCGHDAT